MRISDWSSDVCSSDLRASFRILQWSELDSDKACSLYYPLCYAKGRRRSVPFCIIASNGMTFAARLDEFDQQIALIGEEGEQLSYADLARRADTFAVDHFGGPSAGKRLVLLQIRNDKIGRESCRERVCQYV